MYTNVKKVFDLISYIFKHAFMFICFFVRIDSKIWCVKQKKIKLVILQSVYSARLFVPIVHTYCD